MIELLFVLIILVLGVFFIVVGSFVAACFCVGLLTNCDMDTAAEKVRKFLGNLWTWGKERWTEYKDKKANDDPALEIKLHSGCEAGIRQLIGEQRYQDHYSIGASDIEPPLIFARAGDNFNLSYIGNSVYYADENERQRIESKLTDVTKKWLKRFDCDTRVLTEWRVRDDLDMPVLFIYYAKTSKQKEILADELASRCQAVVTRNTAVIDDTEEVDLF